MMCIILRFNPYSIIKLFSFSSAFVKRFSGLEEDFNYITAYENSSFSKPNPKYFEEILNKFDLNADEVILFGNNTLEDAYCASKVGIKTYLIDGFIIDKQNMLDKFELIKMEDIIPTIKKHM